MIMNWPPSNNSIISWIQKRQVLSFPFSVMGQECVGVAAKSLSVQEKYLECRAQVNEPRGFYS